MPLKQINRRVPVGPYRPKHIFLQETEEQSEMERKQEQDERNERLEEHYNRRKRRVKST